MTTVWLDGWPYFLPDVAATLPAARAGGSSADHPGPSPYPCAAGGPGSPTSA